MTSNTWPNPPRAGTCDRHCQYCGDPAEIFDVDGAWCTPQCQTYDRQSETTYWRKAVTA